MKTRKLTLAKLALMLFVVLLTAPAQSQGRPWGGSLSLGIGGTIINYPDSAVIGGVNFSSIETEMDLSFIAIVDGTLYHRIASSPFFVRGGFFAGGGIGEGKVSGVVLGMRSGDSDFDIKYSLGGGIVGLMLLHDFLGLYFDYGIGGYSSELEVDVIVNTSYSFEAKNELLHLLRGGAFFKLGNTPITLGVELGGLFLGQEDNAAIEVKSAFFGGARIGVIF